MYRAELYVEFSENRTGMMLAEGTELANILRKLQNGVIIERMQSKYRIYYFESGLQDGIPIQDMSYHLKIEPAARIRFEGSMDEYKKFLNEINENYNTVQIYSKLREKEVESDFFIMDIYYAMK